MFEEESGLFGEDSQATPGIKTFLGWVYDSHEFFRDSRWEMWRDCEMYDGVQWTPQQAEKLRTLLGMQALTINRTFPVLNMVLGTQALGRMDIIAKGRSHIDSADLSETMSEAIKFVDDQNEGVFQISAAFKDECIPGFGCIEVLKNTDPRKESVKWAQRRWKEIWWDPHGTPWFNVDDTRYVFNQKWVDLHDLMMEFPAKKEEIGEYFSIASSGEFGPPPDYYQDSLWEEFEEKEEYWRSQVWVDRERKRVQPVQMWYTVKENTVFATFRDGRAIVIPEGMPFNQQYELLTAAQEVVVALVPRMRVATFLGNVMIKEEGTPHHHDEFPFVPFVGYMDRFRMPFGVPRQLRDMDIEVNKRRTTALAKLNARRVLVEKGAVDDYQKLREEATRPDGLIIANADSLTGQKPAIVIEDHQGDLRGQVLLLEQSEREIQEMSGANAEVMGYESNVISGIALEKKQRRGATVTAPLFDNLKRSKKRLGYLTVAGVQQHWTQEKVIRVTDRKRGADKLVILNERVRGSGPAQVSTKRDITQGKYDIVVSEDMFSDTMREKYAEMLIEVTRRAAPEAIPLIIDVAFEMIDIPMKDFILMRLRQAFNLDVPPDEDEMSREQLIEQLRQAKEEEKRAQAEIEGLQKEKMELENEEALAKIKKLIAQAKKEEAETEKLEVESESLLSEDSRKRDENRRDEEAHGKEMRQPAGKAANE